MIAVFPFAGWWSALISRPVRDFYPLLLALALAAVYPQAHAQAPTNQPARPLVSTNRALLRGDDLEQALRKLRPAEGLKVEVFASEPLIQNPVSFSFDEKGRAYVVETHRRRTSVFDIRNHPDWVDADFSFRTVQDRSNFFRKVLIPENKELPEKLMVDRNGDGKFDSRDLEVESERIRRIEDKNQDGVADSGTTFADGFKTVVSGVAAGVVARKNDVYLACIPDLWLLRDQNGDGVADGRQSLLDGFGVHISFGGHDLHGLRFGPDGKLYFSIADRGLHVVSEGKTNAVPDSGAIMRCNPDGTEFEVIATGLRNPQELAFDQYGNLWTGDNNGDGGDKARWLYVVEGGDYAWHIGWQHLPRMGAWNAEQLWSLPPTNTAAFLIPPVAHIGHGPAGLAFYPGTGLPPMYNNHFFMCDFPGGVNAFTVVPQGAGFVVQNFRRVLWELYPVDVDFGPRGGFYVLDWVEGWEKTGKGRLFRVSERGGISEQAALATAQVLAAGFDQKSNEELGSLMGHVDMRVRLEAQFTLAARGTNSTNILVQAAAAASNELTRLHAIWALGQIGRADSSALHILLALATDPFSPEVRAQSLKVLGDARFTLASDLMLRALNDSSARVRYFAALGLGKLDVPDATALIAFLSQNNDVDPFLRHAGVMALTWINDFDTIDTAARDRSPAVRIAALLAMRRLQRPEVAMFLYDGKPSLVLEAARAIYDAGIENGMTQLAALIAKPVVSEPLTRRILHANFRLGRLENALALSEFASNNNIPGHLRAEAVELLGQWGMAPKRDLFTGLWRPLPPREARGASLTFRSELPNLLKANSVDLRRAAVQAAVRLEIDAIAPELLRIVATTNEPSILRLESFKGLVAFKAPQLKDAVSVLANDSDGILRREAAAVQMQTAPPATALQNVLTVLDRGSMPEKQQAFEQLAVMKGTVIDPVLLMWLDRVASGKAPKELHLEIVEAAAKRNDPLIKSTLERYKANKAKEAPLGEFSEVLAGGNAENGRKLFFERADVACLRCHKIKGEGGDVGPDLTGIGARVDRAYLAESILFPNNRVAKGYENLLIRLKDETSYAGLLKGEDAENIFINSPEDGDLKIPKASIESLDLGLSAMPGDVASMLNKRDLRDLIEFLATLK